jgi:hypothetical protein
MGVAGFFSIFAAEKIYANNILEKDKAGCPYCIREEQEEEKIWSVKEFTREFWRLPQPKPRLRY